MSFASISFTSFKKTQLYCPVIPRYLPAYPPGYPPGPGYPPENLMLPNLTNQFIKLSDGDLQCELNLDISIRLLTIHIRFYNATLINCLIKNQLSNICGSNYMTTLEIEMSIKCQIPRFLFQNLCRKDDMTSFMISFILEFG